MRKCDFCMEMQVEETTESTVFWVVFVHASTDAKERKSQWDYLIERKQYCGSKWILGVT